MSGTALGYQTDRMDVDELNYAFTEAKEMIEDFIGPNFRADMIPYFSEKKSFGDLDILVKMHPDVWGKLCNYLYADEFIDVVKNGNVLSFAICKDQKKFQVDLIYSGNSMEDHWVAFEYFSYNDLGNLVGRLAHRLGFKYGHDGLRWIIRDSLSDTKVICDLSISKETSMIYKFLDLDYSKLARGFRTREEIFEFVSKSKYFHPDIFLLENRNATSRRRDSKRETYKLFLEWCAANTFPNSQSYSREQTLALRKVKLDEALKYFNKREEYTNEMCKYNQIELVKLMYNGDLVSEWTGLMGRELGVFMQYMRKSFDLDDSKAMIELGPERIESWVKEIHATYKDTEDV